MFATAFAAIAALQVIFFRKNNIAFGTIIEILGVKFWL
jgi:hypothetical protein